MRVFLFLLLLTLGAMYAKAQNYKLISPDRTVLFEKTKFDNDTNAQILSLKVKVEEGPIHNIYTNVYEAQYFVHSGFQPEFISWLGKGISVTNDTLWSFQNIYGEPIYIYSNKNVGDSWIAYDYYLMYVMTIGSATGTTLMFYKDYREPNQIRVKATVESNEKETFLGITDSVKTISFLVYDYDDNIVASYLNGYTIKISKNYGLIKTINFKLFPDITPSEDYYGNEMQELNIVGFTNSQENAGVQNVTTTSAYDFQVGDELHIKELHSNQFYDGSIFYSEKHIIKKYLSRTDMVDTITYNVEQTIYRKEYSDKKNMAWDTTYKEVLLEKIPLNIALESLPSQLVTKNYKSGDKKLGYTMKIINGIPAKISSPSNPIFVTEIPYQNWEEIYYADGGCYVPEAYLEGLGGPYYKIEGCNSLVTTYNSSRELVYFKKGEIESGNAMNIELSQNPVNNINFSKVTLYPSPAKDYIISDIGGDITFCNSNGQIVLSGTIEPKLQFDISQLSPDLYTVTIDSNSKIYKGVVLVR